MASKTDKRSDNNPKPPNALVYALAVVLCGAYMRLVFGLRVDRRALRDVKGPVVVLGNHASNLDFITMAVTLYPIRLNFMVSTYFFRHPMLDALLRFMGAFPKRQFVPDTGSVRACLATAKAGRSIGIFPEGQVTYTGATMEIDKSIAKLCKKLGMTVVVCRACGNHLSRPKWARGKTFHGKILSTASVVYTPDQLAALSADEIYDGIYTALDYNDHEWQRENHVKFRPQRDAEGLQSILYRCPACNTDFTISAKNNRLICDKCGHTVEIDDNGLLVSPNGKAIFDNPVDWFNWEYAQAETDADAGAFPYTCTCTLYTTTDGKFGYTICGAGVMTADWRGLHYEGTKNGEPFAFSGLVEHQTNLTHNMGFCGVDILVGNEDNYALSPDEQQKMMKFISFYQIAHRRFEAAKGL